ncbi:MAG: hypothetical protein ACRDYD_12025, partial [Acidimicrobiales bacterium]
LGVAQEGPAPGNDRAAADEAALERRDASFEPLVAALARKLKRALQDEQNAVLDRLRSSSAGEGGALEPAADEEARYRAVAHESLLEAWAAGRGPARGRTAQRDRGREAADTAAAALSAELSGALRRRIEPALEEDSPERAAEVIGAAFREWKGARLEMLAGDHLMAVFAAAALASAPAGSAVRWVVDDEGGPCPDCDDNSLAGAVRAGEPFPTGQIHPPAHAGCRCLLEPTST